MYFITCIELARPQSFSILVEEMDGIILHPSKEMKLKYLHHFRDMHLESVWYVHIYLSAYKDKLLTIYANNKNLLLKMSHVSNVDDEDGFRDIHDYGSRAPSHHASNMSVVS